MSEARANMVAKERDFQNQFKHIRAANTVRVQAPSNFQERHDFFISHASEDKQDVAHPLYEALKELGCSVWYRLP